ncbi:MAG TPA: SIS domain-containing protein [Saprospiraceae bacterium]|nr:SIS domain-containing protein [Saprospiraceae bacterium]
MKTLINQIISESILVKQHLLQDHNIIEEIHKIIDVIVNAYQNDKKVLFCGNGGSAADAQHLAAELSGRFYINRDPLFAEALHVNSSYMTAVANDYSYEDVYSRLVKAMGRKGDILFAISTSGNSSNILKAIESAQSQKMIVIGMTGSTGGKMLQQCDYILKIPSTDTPRIQESHIMIGHIICEMVEKSLFPFK